MIEFSENTSSYRMQNVYIATYLPLYFPAMLFSTWVDSCGSIVNRNITSTRIQLIYHRVKPILIRGVLIFVFIGQSLNHFYIYAPNSWWVSRTSWVLQAMSSLIGRCCMQALTKYYPLEFSFTRRARNSPEKSIFSYHFSRQLPTICC